MRTALLALPLVACVYVETPSRVVTDLELDLDAAGLDRASLDQGRGDAVVSGEPVDALRLRVRVLGPSSERRDADVLEDLHMVLETVDATGVAEVWIDGEAPGYSLDTELLLPAGMALSVTDGSGDLEITGTGALVVDDGSGDLDITGVAEAIVRDGSGDLDLSEVAGDAEIEDGSGDLFVSGVGGDVRITDGSGDVHIERVGGVATIVDGSGDIIIGEDAEVVIEENGSGDVR